MVILLNNPLCIGGYLISMGDTRVLLFRGKKRFILWRTMESSF